ncbi:MAG: dihydrofolate reductase family protein [Ignavibacteria bacterium]
MRKIIWAINVTIDGYADHTVMLADDEMHYFYANLLNNIDTVLFGRKTYELLASFWPTAYEDPRSTKGMIEFAHKINSLSKVVFSNKLKKTDWNNSKIIKENLVEEVMKMKEQSGKNLSIGGISIASVLMERDLIDEYWFVVQPIILGKGIQLFGKINKKKNLRFIDLKIFNSGVVVLHYKNSGSTE